MPCAARRSEPAQITSSDLRIRSERPCSPSAQRSASARFDLPEPLGPTTALIPGPELDQRALGERLEPLDAQPEQPRRGAHGPSSRRRVVRGQLRRRPRPSSPADAARADLAAARSRRSTSSASAAADVSAIRRDGPSPTPSVRPLDDDLDPELLLVVGPDRLDQPVQRPLAGGPLGVLLEPALGALERRDREVRGELLRGQLVDPVARGVPAEVEVDRADEGLERRRQQRRPDAPAALGLALAEQEERAEVEPGRQAREPGRAHDRGPARGQDALVIGRVAPVQRLGDREADDGVAEELEALVVAGGRVGVLVQVLDLGSSSR